MNDFPQPLNEEDQRLRAQLQHAVRSTETPPFLEARIRHAIHEQQHGLPWVRRLAPVAAMLVAGAGLYVTYQLGHLRLTTNSQNSYIAAISNQVGSLMRVGLRDHVHCTVFRKYPKDPPKVEELVQQMGPEYQDLVRITRNRVPADFRLVMAHQCKYQGRPFVHIALKNDSRLISLVIARKGDGESFETEKILPALTQSNLSFYQAGVQRFDIAAFETREHLVYVVSDLPGGKNMQLMLALAPDVRAFLNSLEG